MDLEMFSFNYNYNWKIEDLADILSGFGLHSHWIQERFLGRTNQNGQSVLHCDVFLHLSIIQLNIEI